MNYKEVFEWDRPYEGMYANGGIRIITSRSFENNQVGACHKASTEEIRWVLQMEELQKINKSLNKLMSNGLLKVQK